MALTLSQAQLSAAIRLGDSPEEVAEATRLLAYVTAAITKHLGVAFDGAPDAVVEEAAIRLGAYLFDMPNAGRGLSYANAGRNSGAWTILLPYRIHRAGNTDDAVAAAQQAIGTTGNPVTGLAITVDGKLEVIFADGATVELDLPAGMGGGVLDQTARDAAAAAQGTANNAATAATAAADIANANTGRLDAFPAGTGESTRRRGMRRTVRNRRRTVRRRRRTVRKPISTRTRRQPTTRTARPERRRRMLNPLSKTTNAQPITRTPLQGTRRRRRNRRRKRRRPAGLPCFMRRQRRRLAGVRD